jgi:hypothetical protein
MFPFVRFFLCLIYSEFRFSKRLQRRPDCSVSCASRADSSLDKIRNSSASDAQELLGTNISLPTMPEATKTLGPSAQIPARRRANQRVPDDSRPRCQGIIRNKDVRGKKLDEPVEQLLAE